MPPEYPWAAMHITTILALTMLFGAAPVPLDDAALEHLLRTERRFVLCVWSPHMPLSVDAVHALIRAGRKLDVPVVPLLDPRADLTFARTTAAAAGLPD